MHFPECQAIINTDFKTVSTGQRYENIANRKLNEHRITILDYVYIRQIVTTESSSRRWTKKIPRLQQRTTIARADFAKRWRLYKSLQIWWVSQTNLCTTVTTIFTWNIILLGLDLWFTWYVTREIEHIVILCHWSIPLHQKSFFLTCVFSIRISYKVNKSLSIPKNVRACL